jgi:hypothetical protein
MSEMNPQEQKALYRKMQLANPQWPTRFLSGYVAGAQHETQYQQPVRFMQEQAHDLDHYALGYLVGFAMYRGPDAETEPWFHLVGLIVEEARGPHQAV